MTGGLIVFFFLAVLVLIIIAKTAIVVPQHSDAMRYVFRSPLEHIVRIHHVRAYNLVCRDSNAYVVSLRFATQGRHDNVLRQKSLPPALGNRNINERYNCSA